jgi:hypothetical protein
MLDRLHFLVVIERIAEIGVSRWRGWRITLEYMLLSIHGLSLIIQLAIAFLEGARR